VITLIVFTFNSQGKQDGTDGQENKAKGAEAAGFASSNLAHLKVSCTLIEQTMT
jgi:hypothetical protein